MTEFLRLSLDLGGFPLIELTSPSVPADLSHLIKIQQELLSTNANIFKQSLLHILADQISLNKQQLENLRGYLSSDSFQFPTLI